MILGETLLGQIINNLLEKVCVNLVIWGSNKKLRIVVKKNLQSHFSRNSKTSVMFSLCLAYIIFAAALFSLMGGSLSRQIEWNSGADICISAGSINYPLPEEKIRNLLEEKAFLDEDLIEEYSFVTFPLNYYSNIHSTVLCPVSGISSKNVKLYGVEPNILRTMNNRYFSVEEYNQLLLINNDPIASLNQIIDPQKEIKFIPEVFESENKGKLTTKSRINYYYPLNATRTYTRGYPLLIGKNFMIDTYSEIDEWLPLVIDGNDNDISEVYLLKPVGILNKFPGFTGVATGALSSEYVGFISMDHYKEFVNRTSEYLYEANPKAKLMEKYQYPETPYKKFLYIKVAEHTTDFQIEDIINNILRYIDDSTKFSITNLRQSVKSTNSIAELLNNIFYFSKYFNIILFYFFIIFKIIVLI